MWWKTGRDAHNQNQPKRDLLAMTEADREAFTEEIKEHLKQRARWVRLNREAHALFARAPPPGHYSSPARELFGH